MLILAIDPGTTKSGWCRYSDGVVISSGVMENSDMLDSIEQGIAADVLAVEMVASYGMAVGAEVFRTVWWTGRFAEAWRKRTGNLPVEVYRMAVKLHLCGSPRAKDANIRQALIDLYGPGKEKAIGKKASPGPLFGVTSHAWPALAVAVTAHSQLTSLRSAAA
jgi:hypothetical protein